MAVTTLLLVAATGVIGASLVAWSNASFGIQQMAIANQTNSRINLVRESLVVEDVWFRCNPYPCGTHYADVTIRNTGTLAITVSKIYVNNTQVWTGSTTIPIGTVTTIPNVQFSWSSGHVQSVLVHTSRGSDVKQDWKP